VQRHFLRSIALGLITAMGREINHLIQPKKSAAACQMNARTQDLLPE
jgi:hypothetical protein